LSQGLWWLRQREVKRVNKDDEREMLHPLWAEYRLPDDTPLYVKQIGSLVSLQRPMASSRGLGGILSDEMGLGKTLQLLALCSLDKPYSHRSIAGCEISAHVMSITSAVPEEVVGIDSSALTVEPHSDRMLVDGAETEIASGSRLKQKSEECIKLNQGLKRSADCISDVVDLTSEDVCSEIAGDGAEAEQKEQSGFRKINGSLGCNAFLDQRSSAHKLHSPSLQTRLMKKEEPKVLNGGTLVICPMSILGQWEDEIAAHLNPGHLRVAVHYGGDRTLSAHVLSRPDIVLTTYGVLSAEFVRLGQSNGRATLFAIEWHRIILDEAHYIKGRHTQVTQAVFALKGERRWAVTGTPVQNKLDDLYPLLRFIHLEPWSEVSFWQKHVIRPFEERKDVQALKQLHKALQPLLLRRTKESKDSSGNPILSLPPRTVEVVELDFSVEERDFYDALFTQSRTRFAAFVAAGKVMNNYASILEMLLRLRQCCAHPYLILSRSDVRSFDNPDLVRLALRLSSSPSSSSIVPDEATAQGLTRDLQDANVESAQECPICLESVEDPVVTPCAHVFCRECINDAIRRSSGTLCPNCRTPLSRSELISVPPPVNRCNFDAETNWRSSTKIDFLLQQLLSLNANESSELIKSVVFSQWTGMLDLVEIALRRAGIVFTRLDGSMSQQQRADNVATFSTSAKVSVLLISLKAGGVGINLTAASYVFLLDMWWNPAVDEQVKACEIDFRCS
jgi:SNF2 family DNA or RNA helicase